MKKFLFMIFALGMLLSCNEQPNSPDDTTQLLFKFTSSESSKLPRLILSPDSGINENIQHILKAESVEEVKVMILDFSIYDSSQQYFDSQDYQDYKKAQQNWTSEFDQWGEYEKLFKDHFRVVANSNLSLEETQAKGVVAGVIGLNYIFLGIIGHGEIQTIYESDVIAKEGETATVYMGEYYYNYSK